MANICTNILYCSTEHEDDLKRVERFLEEHFEAYLQNCGNSLEAEFESFWDYPEVKMNRLMSTIECVGKLYVRILSYCLENEYACLRVFKDGAWELK